MLTFAVGKTYLDYLSVTNIIPQNVSRVAQGAGGAAQKGFKGPTVAKLLAG